MILKIQAKKMKKNFIPIYLLILSLVIITNICFAQDGCVPDGTGPCPDICNPACCNYDPDAAQCVPINQNFNYLIGMGMFLLFYVLFKSKRKTIKLA